MLRATGTPSDTPSPAGPTPLAQLLAAATAIVAVASAFVAHSRRAAPGINCKAPATYVTLGAAGSAPSAVSHRPSSASASSTSAPSPPFPKLCVFDLDMCMWHPEMFTLDSMPSKVVRGPLGDAGEGVVGVYSGGELITLFPGALRALQEIHSGRFPGMQLAVASSADTPLAARIARATMRVLEVVPGVTMYDVLTAGWGDDRALMIGREPPLSADKAATHLPLIRQATAIPYDEMLFFDDSEWSDHCGEVERRCQGVAVQRTPKGMQFDEFLMGLKRFAEAKRASSPPPQEVAMFAVSGLFGKDSDKNYMASKIGNKVDLNSRHAVKGTGDLVNVTFLGAGGIERTIQVPDDRYILDTAIEQGVELPYSCRGGICGACVGKVVKGETDMSDIDDVGFTLDEEQQQDGMSLLCMARPVGDCVIETQSDWGMSAGFKKWEGPSGYIQGRAPTKLMGD